jgi:surface protein
MKRGISDILKDIDRIKNIKEPAEDANRVVLDGVTFEGGVFTDGLWTYTKGNDNNVTVTVNAEEFSRQFTGESAVLDHKHMPYERLIDTDGNEYMIVSYARMFDPLRYHTMKSLTIKNWTNANVTDMSNMFYGCRTLTSLTLCDNFDTSSVTNMNCMFYGCSALMTFTMGDKFDTSGVTNMSGMFYDCPSLASLTLGDNFDTSSVTQMGGMFCSCSALTTLTLGDKFDTSNVTTMVNMFSGCSALTTLTLGDKFDTSNVTTMVNMFCICRALTSLTLGDKFDTSNVTTMGNMFNGCDSLTSLTLYHSAEAIIKELPYAAWKINGSNDDTVTIREGPSVTWNPPTLLDQWEDEQWTLSRTI